MEKQKEQLIEYFKKFYLQNLKLYQAGQIDKLRPLYKRACQDLAKMVPVQRIFDPKFSEVKLQAHKKVIVAANHIASPNIFQIKDPRFIQKLGISAEKLLWETLHPVIFRHYPIVNFLRENNFDTHIIANLETPPLDKFSASWGAIHIPWEGSSRLRLIIQQIKKLPNSQKQAIIFFPEGSDSWGNPLKGQYYLLPFKSGFVLTAQKLDLPILPISLVLKPKPLHYCVFIHPLIDLNQRRLKRVDIITCSTRKRIKKGTQACLCKSLAFTNRVRKRKSGFGQTR